jgi:hypothetical protein
MGLLRAALEQIRGLQHTLGPPTTSPEASGIELRLNCLAWCLRREYEETLKDVLASADPGDPLQSELIYRRILDDLEMISSQDDRFPEREAEVLRKLMSICHQQKYLSAIEGFSLKLSKIKFQDASPFENEAAEHLADSFKSAAPEIQRLLDDLRLTTEPPLHAQSASTFPALHRALRGGHDNASRILSKAVAALEELDLTKQNGVIVAAATGKVTILDPIFQNQGSLITGRDLLDRTALCHAAHNGDFDSYSRLLDAGADRFDRDSSGQSILRVAARAGRERIVDDLLRRGVSPNDDTLLISSALHDAARGGHTGICRLLLDHDAWANIKVYIDGKNQSPADVARENNFFELADMIEAAALRPENNFWSLQPSHISSTIPPQGPERGTPAPTISVNSPRRQIQYRAASANHQTPQFLLHTPATSTPIIGDTNGQGSQVRESTPLDFRQWLDSQPSPMSFTSETLP